MICLLEETKRNKQGDFVQSTAHRRSRLVLRDPVAFHDTPYCNPMSCRSDLSSRLDIFADLNLTPLRCFAMSGRIAYPYSEYKVAFHDLSGKLSFVTSMSHFPKGVTVLMTPQASVRTEKYYKLLLKNTNSQDFLPLAHSCCCGALCCILPL